MVGVTQGMIRFHGGLYMLPVRPGAVLSKTFPRIHSTLGIVGKSPFNRTCALHFNMNYIDGRCRELPFVLVSSGYLRQRTHEEIGYVCTYVQWIYSRVPSDFGGLFELGVPTGQFASYQVKQVLLYGIKRYFKTVKLEPVYQFGGVQDADHPEVKMNAIKCKC